MIRLENPGAASSRGRRGGGIRPGAALPGVASSSSFSLPLSAVGTAGGSASRLCSPRPGRRRGGSHDARARGLLGCLPRPSPARAGSAPSAPAATGTPGRPRAELLATRRGRSPRSCPESRSPGAQLGRCRSGARCRGPRAAAAPRRAPGRPHLA